MKIRKSILCFLIITVAALCAFAFSACDKTPAETVTESETYMTVLDFPKQYYVIGEELDLTNGKLFVGTENAGGVKGEIGYKLIDMTDPEVQISYPGTAVADGVKTVVLTYRGLKASYRYHVTEEIKNAIKSVSFTVDVNGVAPTQKYAKSTTSLRKNADFNDLMITIKYRDSAKIDYIRYISDIPFSSSTGVSIKDFDVTSVGKRTATLSYLATDYFLDYEVVDDDWIDSVEIAEEDKQKIKLNYFVGSKINLGGANFTLRYNSGKEETVPIPDDAVSGFDSSAEIRNAAFAITDPLKGAETFNYNVYDADATAGMVKVEKFTGTGFLEYMDDMTYEEYLAANIFHVYMDGKNYVEVNGLDEHFAITVKNGGTFDKAAYNEAIKRHQAFTLVFTYGGNEELVAESTFTVVAKWSKTEITGWQNPFTVQKNGKLDFGDAQFIKIREDGSVAETLSIQEEYEKTAADSRKINFWTTTGGIQKYDFDTSVVGTFTNYCITVVGEVTVNGVAYDHHNSGRLNITYVVTAVQ